MGQDLYLGKGVNQKLVDEVKSRVFSSNEQLLCAIKGVLTRGKRGKRGLGSRLSGGAAKDWSFRGSPKGLLLVTSNRAIFYVKLILGRFEQLVFPYDRITSVGSRGGLLGDAIDVVVGSDNLVVDRVPKGDGEIAAQKIRDMMGSLKAPVAVLPQVDVTSQIEKLGELKEKGLITDKEFKTKKAELLKKL